MNKTEITLLYLWEIKKRSLPYALWHMAIDRLALRFDKDIAFFKSIGTGSGKTFTPKDASATRWGLVLTINADAVSRFDKGKVVKSWRKISGSEFRVILQPISSHGKWGGAEPFLPASVIGGLPIAALTRARIKWSMNPKFWRAVPAVSLALHDSAGLIGAIGIGEAPIGLQGTFSIWKDGQSLRNFAYKSEAHISAIEGTQRNNWYSEELFARFEILEMRGQF